MQGWSGSASYLQPSINSSRIQNAGGVILQGKWMPPRTIIVPKAPKPKDNSTRMAKATVQAAPVKAKSLAVHALDAVAFASYGAYYVSYQAARFTPGINPALMGAQAGGLGGDILINYIKIKMGYPQQLNDHGGEASIFPDFLHPWTGEGPKVHIPGWHYDDSSKIDFAW